MLSKWSGVAVIFIRGSLVGEVKVVNNFILFLVLDLFCNDSLLFSYSCPRKYLTSWRTTRKKLIRQHGTYYIVGTCDLGDCLAFVTAWCLLGLKTLPTGSLYPRTIFIPTNDVCNIKSAFCAREEGRWATEPVLAGGANTQLLVLNLGLKQLLLYMIHKLF